MFNNFTSSFPPVFNPDLTTAVTSISKDELFAQTFYANSTLDNSRYAPLTHSPFDFTLPAIRIPDSEIFFTTSGLNPQKANGPK